MVRRLNGRQAFTLIELIISMTIIAVILVIIFGAFRISIRAWEKGEKNIDSLQRYRIVLDLVHRQMMSVSFKKVKMEDKQQYILKGDGKSFEFLSHMAMKPENKVGIVHVKYRVENDGNGNEKLFVNENNLVFLEKEFKPDDIDPDGYFELIPSAQRISFEYLKPQEQGLDGKLQWQESWDTEIDQGIPLAVKMTIVDQHDNTPVVIIAPFYYEEESS